MINKIFDLKAVNFILELEDGQSENTEGIIALRETLLETIDIFTLKKLALCWNGMSEEGQVHIAIKKFGEVRASIFMKYMDYLSNEVKEGRIKL